MSLIIILAALALLFGAAILIIKFAKFISGHGETLTKILLGVCVVMLILASIAYFKPDLIPQLTVACDTVATAIKGFVKPFIG